MNRAWQLVEKNLAATQATQEIQVYMPQLRSKIYVMHGVFNPALTNVSQFFAKHLDARWNGEHFLEIGTATGFIALLLAKKGACVTATDINGTTKKCVEKNINKFQFGKRICYLKSDLFKNPFLYKFDTIVFNPPLSPVAAPVCRPHNEAEKRLIKAIYDNNFNCIRRFFKQVKKHLTHEGRIFIVYSNLGEVSKCPQFITIPMLCDKYGFREKIIAQKTVHGETYTVYVLYPLWG